VVLLSEAERDVLVDHVDEVIYCVWVAVANNRICDRHLPLLSGVCLLCSICLRGESGLCSSEFDQKILEKRIEQRRGFIYEGST
jgi:hypothetical protein